MASVSVPATRIRLAQHLCGVNAGFEIKQGVARWDLVPTEQYVPNINFGEPNNQTELVSGFGRSLRFSFVAGTRSAGNIKVRLAASPYDFGEIKIADSQEHSIYTGLPAAAWDSNASGVPARYDIYWDYDTNYSSGFEIMVNSGTAGGSYRGVADNPAVGVPNLSNMTVNGNGAYFDDGGAVSDFTVIIPWDDINAVNNIYVYFAETVGTTTTTTLTTTTTVAPTECASFLGTLRNTTSAGACADSNVEYSYPFLRPTGQGGSYPAPGNTIYPSIATTCGGRPEGTGYIKFIDGGVQKVLYMVSGTVQSVSNC